MPVPKNRRKESKFEVSHNYYILRDEVTKLLLNNYVYLQTKYTLSETGKVIKKIKSTTVTRERRKLKAYKSLLDKGKMPYKDIEQAYKSWMGNYAKLMSKQLHYQGKRHRIRSL